MPAVAQIQIVVDDAQLQALGPAAQNAAKMIAQGFSQSDVQGALENLGFKATEISQAFQQLGLAARQAARAVDEAGRGILSGSAAMAELNKFSDAAAISFVGLGNAAAGAAGKITGSFYQVRLLSTELGVGMPRAMEQVIARTPMLASAIGNMFPVLAAVGFAAILGTVAEKIGDLASRAFDWDGSLKQMETDTVALSNSYVDLAKHSQAYSDAMQLLGKTGTQELMVKQQQANRVFEQAAAAYAAAEKALSDYQAKLRTTADQGYAALGLTPEDFPASSPSAAQGSQIAKLQEQVNTLKAALLDATRTMQQLGQQVQDSAGRDAKKAFDDAAKAADQLYQNETAAFAQLRQFGSGGEELTGLAKINEDYQKQLGLIGAITFAHISESDALEKGSAAVDRVTAKMNADTLNWESTEIAAWQKTEYEAQDAEDKKVAATEKALAKMDEDMQRYADQTNDIQERAAEAAAPPWEASYMRIHAEMVKQMQQAQEEIQRLENQRVVTTEQGEEMLAQRVAAIQVEAQQQAVDQMSSQIQSFFDAVTGGHIGQYFLKQFETLVSRMVAQWILGMGQMQQSTSGVFGGILNMLGLGGGGAGGAAGAGAGGGIFGSGALGGGIFSLLGGGGASAAGISAADWGAITSAEDLGYGYDSGSLIASAGGLSSTGAGGLTGLLSRGGLAGAGGLSSILGPLALAGGGAYLMGQNSGLLSDVTGGLMAGAGIGAMIGMAGGPIGMLVGAALGAVGGIFEDIFGSSAHSKGQNLRHQAQQQIDTIVQEYDTYQLTYASAISELESLNTQLNKSLHSLGDKENYPGIPAAEQQIYNTEVERQKRAAEQFGPAQFAEGGAVGPAFAPVPAAWSAAASAGMIPSYAMGGPVPAILHSGEYVLNAGTAARLGRGRLDAMNSGRGGSDVHITNNIHTMDTQSFTAWLDGDAGRAFLRWFGRQRREGYA